MTEILDPKNTDPANTNKDGVVSDFEQKVYSDAQKAKSASGAGSAGSGTSGKSAEDYPVLWQKGNPNVPSAVGGGAVDQRKTKTEAIAAYTTGQLSSTQKNILDSAYAKYKAAGGRSGKKGWWTDYVNAAADADKSPFDIVTGQYGAATDGSGANGYTTGSGKSSTSVAVSMYTPELANQILDAAVTATFGSTAQLTNQQRTDFYAKLTAGQKQGTVTKYSTKGGKTTTTVVKSFDEEAFRKNYIGTVLEGMISGKEQLDLGGKAGEIQDTLRKYSDDMGVIRSDRDILSDVRRVVKGEVTAEDAANEVRKQSAVLYKNFADRLNSDPTLTVRDLANPYIKLMADTFETDMNNISLTNPTIQLLLSADKPPSTGEFYKQLRGMTEFRNTTTAQKEASSFASGLASAMGF
jgi:hypothetical protein